MKLPALFATAEGLIARFGSYLQSPLLFVLRLYWGWSFMQTGWGKLTHLDRTAGYFASLDIPWPKLNAVLAGGTECVGGLLLLLGLASRLATVPLVFTMIVAFATAHREDVGALFSEPDRFTAAEPFLFLLVAVLVLAFGPGKFSLDVCWRKRAA